MKFEQQMWGIDDMKAMADTSSEVYKYARSIGLPDGLIRSLKADLRVFKSQWRDKYQPTVSGGGFVHE